MLRLVAAILAAVLLAPTAAGARETLPLGPPWLAETRTADVLAPGVVYSRIERGRASAHDGWTVDAAIVRERTAALDLAGRLRAAGFDADEDPLERPPDDRLRGPLGYRVHSGLFATRAEADTRAAAIRAAGLPVRGSVFTAEDGGPTTGPWVVHVLAIDPFRYRGAVEPVLANDVVVDREPLSSISRRHGALAAVNGGYFVIGSGDGTPGDLAGSSVLDGELVSEAVDGRTDLVLWRHFFGVTAVRDRQVVRAADGAVRDLDGDNRRPGAIRACGGSGGDLPTELPLHDVTCSDPSELIRFTPIFGAATDAGAGVEAVLDAAGRVVVVRERAGARSRRQVAC